MQITVNQTEISYDRHLGTQPVILLHGWGGSRVSMQGIYQYLSRLGMDVINPDLPGFGQSPPPPDHFTIEDYAKCIKELVEKLELKNVTLIGHSFGGRICILLGQEKWLKRIVLTGGAGIKPRFSLKKYLKIRRYKRAVKRGSDTSGYGSKDYKALNAGMRKIFVRVVNRHLNDDAKKIAVPALLVWGKHDSETPVYMARKLKRTIPDCGLAVLDGGHFVYAERHYEFCNIIKSFVSE